MSFTSTHLVIHISTHSYIHTSSHPVIHTSTHVIAARLVTHSIILSLPSKFSMSLSFSLPLSLSSSLSISPQVSSIRYVVLFIRFTVINSSTLFYQGHTHNHPFSLSHTHSYTYLRTHSHVSLSVFFPLSPSPSLLSPLQFPLSEYIQTSNDVSLLAFQIRTICLHVRERGETKK